MSAPLTISAAMFVRGWTWFYTCGTPAFVRDGRRQEIASDLWEQQRDLAGESDARVAGQILLRLLAGVTDDLQWRFEHRGGMSPLRTRALVAATTAVALLVTLWANTIAQLLNEEPPPIPPLMSFVAAQPPPPPPPPPPFIRPDRAAPASAEPPPPPSPPFPLGEPPLAPAPPPPAPPPLPPPPPPRAEPSPAPPPPPEPARIPER